MVANHAVMEFNARIMVYREMQVGKFQDVRASAEALLVSEGTIGYGKEFSQTQALTALLASHVLLDKETVSPADTLEYVYRDTHDREKAMSLAKRRLEAIVRLGLLEPTEQLAKSKSLRYETELAPTDIGKRVFDLFQS